MKNKKQVNNSLEKRLSEIKTNVLIELLEQYKFEHKYTLEDRTYIINCINKELDNRKLKNLYK